MDACDYRILQYGLFDSAIKFPNVVTTNDRLLDCFEIELFPSDCPGIAYVNGTAHPMVKGLLICGKPGQYRHSRLNFKCCYLHIQVENRDLYELLHAIPDAMMMADDDDLASLFCKMSAQNDETVLDRLFLQSCANRILFSIIKRSKHPVSDSPIPSIHAKALSAAEKFIQSHYAEKLSLSMLAKKASLSPVYFHKLFTASYGMTPAEYALKVRMAAAKQLLIASDDSMLEISEKCGFSSQSYFTSRFKEKTGLSPLKFKKKMLSQIDL
ncbi:MAG: helix-turn-helix transcriptional regulator [Kiritimatiellia bacterium]